jgi:hypothetical protein
MKKNRTVSVIKQKKSMKYLNPRPRLPPRPKVLRPVSLCLSMMLLRSSGFGILGRASTFEQKNAKVRLKVNVNKKNFKEKASI